MEKIIRTFEVESDLDWAYGIEISKLKEEISRLERLGATSIDIEPYCNYGSSGVDITARSERLETDEEYYSRINRERQHIEHVKKMELDQLRKLQSKYKGDK